MTISSRTSALTGVLTLLTLLVLFAMHGPPTHQPMHRPMHRQMHVPVAAMSATSESDGFPSAAPTMPEGCTGTDACVATLREAAQARPAAQAHMSVEPTRPVSTKPDAAAGAAPRPSARPPDLVTLQISRT